MPAELAASIDDVQPILIDIRNDGYAEAHVDGAHWAPYRMFRGPEENPGALVDVTALEGNLEQLGLEYDLPIVIITEGKTDTDFGAAARVYWTLKSTGFTDLSILNGGQAAWAAAGLPINATVESSIPSELDLTFSHEWLAETSDVEAVTTGAAQAILVLMISIWAARVMTRWTVRARCRVRLTTFTHRSLMTVLRRSVGRRMWMS